MAVSILSLGLSLAGLAMANDGGYTPRGEVPDRREGGRFPKIRAVVTTETIRGYVFVQDGSGSLCLRPQESHPFSPGDVVEATVTNYDARDFWHIADTATPVGKEPPPPPHEVAGREVSMESHHAFYTTASGTVTSQQRTTDSDLVDGSYVPLTHEVLVMACEGQPVRVCFGLGTQLHGGWPALEGAVGAGTVAKIPLPLFFHASGRLRFPPILITSRTT